MSQIILNPSQQITRRHNSGKVLKSWGVTVKGKSEDERFKFSIVWSHILMVLRQMIFWLKLRFLRSLIFKLMKSFFGLQRKIGMGWRNLFGIIHQIISINKNNVFGHTWRTTSYGRRRPSLVFSEWKTTPPTFLSNYMIATSPYENKRLQEAGRYKWILNSSDTCHINLWTGI